MVKAYDGIAGITGTWHSLLEQRKSWSLDPAVAPALCRLVTVERDGDTVAALSIGTKRISFDGELRERVARLLALMNGRRTIRELAAETDEDLDELIEMIGRLYAVAAVWNHADCRVPSGALVCNLDHLAGAFQLALGTRIRSMRDALEKQRSRRLVVGYMFEYFHTVKDAVSHISPAVAMAPTHRSRMILSELLADEYWHVELLRTGLHKLGFSDEDIARSDPLAGTTAFINFLRGAAMTDLMDYAACNVAGESGGESIGRDRQAKIVESFYEFLGSDGIIPPEALKPFAEHELVDIVAGHNSFAGELIYEHDLLTGRQQDSMRRTMLRYLQTCGERERQLVHFYGAPEGPPYFVADELPPSWQPSGDGR